MIYIYSQPIITVVGGPPPFDSTYRSICPGIYLGEAPRPAYQGQVLREDRELAAVGIQRHDPR